MYAQYKVRRESSPIGKYVVLLVMKDKKYNSIKRNKTQTIREGHLFSL